MKRIVYPVSAFLLLFLSAAMTVTETAPSYSIKTGYNIEFKSKDPSGVFKILKGNISFDENDLTSSKFNFTIPVSSISTGNGMMNKKALTEEWFDEEKFPEIKFVSSKIEKSGESFTISGAFTIKGVSKEKKVPMKLTKNGSELTLSGTFTVNRAEHKVGKKSDSVPDIMNITYSIPITKK